MCPLCIEDVEGDSDLQVFSYKSTIAGWTTPNELAWLYFVAQEMDSIVEIGCWMGRSTDALLAGCKGTVWAVDHFKGSKTEREAGHQRAKREDIGKIFLKNVGYHKNLKLLKMDSLEAVKRFEDKSIDMVFIDGGHTYEEVKTDIKAWLPKAKNLICGHDYTGDIKRAVDEVLGTSDPETDVHAFGFIWRKPIKEVS